FVAGAGARPWAWCPSNGAEGGPVRKCRIGLGTRAGDSVRPVVPDSGAFLPVPYWPLRRREDVAAAPPVPVAAADARARQPVRPGRLAAWQGAGRGLAQAHRY